MDHATLRLKLRCLRHVPEVDRYGPAAAVVFRLLAYRPVRTQRGTLPLREAVAALDAAQRTRCLTGDPRERLFALAELDRRTGWKLDLIDVAERLRATIG